MVDRGEPVALGSEWHGDGAAGEDDRASGLAAMIPSSGDGRGPSRATRVSLASLQDQARQSGPHANCKSEHDKES